ncbi:MAG: NAD-dependent epimerase/dehydratase family protein [Solirubrobacterales bacterium]
MNSGEPDRSVSGRPRRVLITGASGFIGRSAFNEFESHGHQVTGTSTSGEGGLSELDLEQPGQITRTLKQARPEVIVHLAGIQSVRECSEHPARAFRVNTGGTATLLREAERLVPGAHFLLVSTAAVYGRTTTAGDPAGSEPRPLSESDPVRPESPYGASKAAAEYLAFEVASRTGMPVTIVRLFNQVGAEQPAAQVPAGFAAALALAEASGQSRLVLEVGDPGKARDFTDIRDTARALRLISERQVTGRLNVCSGETRSLAWIIEGLSDLTELKVVTRRVPERSNPNDVPTVRGSAERLESATGWSPRIPMDESLAGLLENQRVQLRQP